MSELMYVNVKKIMPISSYLLYSQYCIRHVFSKA